MPKPPRTKRKAIRDERREKKRGKQEAAAEARHTPKRRRLDDAGNASDGAMDMDIMPFYRDLGTEDHQGLNTSSSREPEFFGMLSDHEQEYFRSVDEQLDVNDFPSQDERDIYLANVFVEAQGKELKLACSQSCSRLMERLILMSTTRQKKKLFEQLGGHILSLIQHRFASHCCEMLFMTSAPVVTSELSAEEGDEPDGEEQSSTMEELFLLTLDELEGQLAYLLTDKFASHTLRVLLLILSGRPLQDSTTKSLIHGKTKEHISVPWMNDSSELNNQARAVPASFILAAKKIIADSIAGMDATALRVLATHPTGNPVLQLMLELDLVLNRNAEDPDCKMTLLSELLPGAPKSLQEPSSCASELVGSLLYDSIGSRLLETLITHCPGKVFKALFKHILGPRLPNLVRNDIASYPAIRVLNRLGKEDLVASVHQALPEMPKLVSLSRFNVIKTLFERCRVREATSEIDMLLRALVAAYGSDKKVLVPKLCMAEAAGKDKNGQEDSCSKARSARISHGCQLTSTLLSIPGQPSNTIQTSLVSLSSELLLSLSISSAPTSCVMLTALSTPAGNKVFHKVLVAALMKDIMILAQSTHGSKVLNAIISMPSRSDGIALPFHMKEQIMNMLAQNEGELRESYEGRRVWRTWKGDIWRTRRTEWIAWAKEVDSTSADKALLPWQKKASAVKGTHANSVKVNTAARQSR